MIIIIFSCSSFILILYSVKLPGNFLFYFVDPYVTSLCSACVSLSSCELGSAMLPSCVSFPNYLVCVYIVGVGLCSVCVMYFWFVISFPQSRFLKVFAHHFLFMSLCK